MRINNIFHNTNSIIPTLLIETGVTLGRTHQANKTRGKAAASERFVEQGASALVWLYGIQLLKKAGDSLSKAFGIENLNFDIGKDALRNPVKNNKISAKQIGFKAGNIIVSTFIATYFIGFILPKINYKISSKIKEQNKEDDTKLNNFVNFTDFEKKTKSNNISFGSLIDLSSNLAYSLENDATKRLLITDIGVVGGRYKNARSKKEKIENLFRDIASIYFYLFCSKHIVKAMSSITKNADIHPKALEDTANVLKEKASGLNYKDFIKKALGSKESRNAAENLSNRMFKDKEIMPLEEFINIYPYHQHKAFEMSKLQPVFDCKFFLSKMQAYDVLNDGLTSNPEFLNKVMYDVTGGKSNDKYRFVSKKYLENIRKSVDKFVEQVANYAKKHNQTVTKELIEKVQKQNTIKNFAFNSTGLIISTFALGILIPKLQYYIGSKLKTKEENDEQK